MSKKLIVGNWKMHTSVAEAILLLTRLDQHIKASKGVEIVLCPPSISLDALRRELASQKNEQKFGLGIQNIYDLDEGAFTGEISVEMVQGLVEWAIVGHSERRIHFGERDKQIAKKVAACLRHDIKPILCVGEKINDRTDGHAKRVVSDQLAVDMSEITASEVGSMVIAYEPVWAIGTGEFAKPDDVEQMTSHIRASIREMYDDEVAGRVRILYGGSVDPDNCASYLKIDGVDGLLVGGASVNYAKFSKIVAKAD